MTLFRDKGVVLRTYRLGEADKIIVLLTEHHGKVRAVAKGIRRTASKFGARLEPMSHVAMLMWQGRSDLDVVNQVEVIDHFRLIREDLDRVARGLSVLEVADQIAQERHADPALYQMVVGALRSLADPTPGRDTKMVVPSFFFKALVLEGGGPVLDVCASCGGAEGSADQGGVELVAFDLTEGGVLCRRCRRGRSITPDGLALLRRILGGDLATVLREPPPPAADEIVGLATEAMESHLDRRLRSIRSVAGM